MNSLYIDRKFTRLCCEGNVLVPYTNDTRRSTVPLCLINHLVIVGNVALDTNVLIKTADAGVVTTLLGGRSLQKYACVYGKPGNDVGRRIAHYRQSLSADYCLTISKRLVAAKVRGHRQLVRAMIPSRPQSRKLLLDGCDRLTRRLTDAANARSLPTLLGIEGTAAKVAFEVLRQTLPPALNFHGRKRRPAPDAVNAMLSLSYTLLQGKAVIAIRKAGLDPTIGFYHQPLHSRDSLACDLIEPLRPRIDSWVWNGFNARTWRESDFIIESNACRLSKTARGRYFALFEAASAPWARALVRGAKQLAGSLTH